MNKQEIECLAQICQKMVRINFRVDCHVSIFLFSLYLFGEP